MSTASLAKAMSTPDRECTAGRDAAPVVAPVVDRAPSLAEVLRSPRVRAWVSPTLLASLSSR